MEIKKCPFCNSENLLVRNTGKHYPSYSVLCCDCVARGPSRSFMTEEEAIAAWNRRARLSEEER